MEEGSWINKKVQGVEEGSWTLKKRYKRSEYVSVSGAPGIKKVQSVQERGVG